MAHQRVPLCGARCTEMVPQGVRQHHVRGLSDVVRRDQRPAVAVQQDGGGCVRPCTVGPSGTADYRHAAVAGVQVEGDCGADGDDSVGHLAEVQETEGTDYRAVFQEELRHGFGYAGGDGRNGYPAQGGHHGRGQDVDACSANVGFDGRHGRINGVRGYGLYQRGSYGTEENNTRVYHGAAA